MSDDKLPTFFCNKKLQELFHILAVRYHSLFDVVQLSLPLSLVTHNFTDSSFAVHLFLLVYIGFLQDLLGSLHWCQNLFMLIGFGSSQKLEHIRYTNAPSP